MRPNKYILPLISAFLIIGSIPLTVFAKDSSNENGRATKDEVVYGKLAQNGKTNNLYVVNSFHVEKPGSFTDYGDYTNIKNLTDLSELNQSKQNEIQFQTDDEEFYYQGELEDESLPWEFSITYLLNGEKISPDELAGKSGTLDIQIETKPNTDIHETFFENYLLQISLTFDPLVFDDIQAPKGTEANEGKNKLINFSVMPGQEETLIVTANVENFSMDPIEISAIPANIALEDPDTDNMTEKFQTLADAITELNDGVKELTDGTSEVRNGANQLSDGSKDYFQGIREIDDSSSELIAGSEQILNVLQEIDDELEQMPELPDVNFEEIDELPDLFRKIAQELQDALDELLKVHEALQYMPDINISENEINDIKHTLKDAELKTEMIDDLIKVYEIAKDIRQIIEEEPKEIVKFIQQIIDYLEETADEIEENIEHLKQLEELEDFQKGFGALASEYASFHDGLVEYTSGVHSLATSYQEIDQGITELHEGTTEIDKGANDLYKGTSELDEEVSEIPDQIDSEVQEMLDDYDFSDFEPVSFVSEKNKHIGVVQFVLQTEKIEEVEPDKEAKQTEEKKGFWERFLDLFR